MTLCLLPLLLAQAIAERPYASPTFPPATLAAPQVAPPISLPPNAAVRGEMIVPSVALLPPSPGASVEPPAIMEEESPEEATSFSERLRLPRWSLKLPRPFRSREQAEEDVTSEETLPVEPPPVRSQLLPSSRRTPRTGFFRALTPNRPAMIERRVLPPAEPTSQPLLPVDPLPRGTF